MGGWYRIWGEGYGGLGMALVGIGFGARGFGTGV